MNHLEQKINLIILGIDLGTANTGYGIVEAHHGKFQLLDFGNITTQSKAKSSHRLKKIYDAVIHLVERHQPEFVVLEDVFFSKNVSSAFAVGEVKGIVKLAAANTDCEVFTYAPAEIKQAVAGYGKASKVQIQKMVQVLLKLTEVPHPDHAADALALAICHARSYKILQLRGKYERRSP